MRVFNVGCHTACSLKNPAKGQPRRGFFYARFRLAARRFTGGAGRL
jgi:hypothetical protein